MFDGYCDIDHVCISPLDDMVMDTTVNNFVSIIIKQSVNVQNDGYVPSQKAQMDSDYEKMTAEDESLWLVGMRYVKYIDMQ